MNTFVSGESSAKGLSVILPYIAVGPAAVAIRRPEIWERLEYGWARLGGLGVAWQGWSKARILARSGQARRGAARRGKARNMARLGWARPGTALLGKARNMGGLFPQEQQTNTTQWKQHTQTHS